MKKHLYNRHTDQWIEVEIRSREYLKCKWYDFWHEWGSLIWMLVGALVLIAVLTLLLIIPTFFFERQACMNDGQVLGIDVVWKWIGGCYYHYNGQWLTESMFKVIFLK